MKTFDKRCIFYPNSNLWYLSYWRIFTMKYPFLVCNDGYTSGLWCHSYSFRRAEVHSRSLSYTLVPRARSCINKQPVFHFKVTKMAIERLSIIKFVELVSLNFKLNYKILIMINSLWLMLLKINFRVCLPLKCSFENTWALFW